MSFRFHNFKVYQDIRFFIKGIFILVNKLLKEYQHDLASQLKRAAISILLNLVEGSRSRFFSGIDKYIKIVYNI